MDIRDVAYADNHFVLCKGGNGSHLLPLNVRQRRIHASWYPADLFRSEKRVARRMIIAVGAYVAVAFLADELTLLLTCLPISRRWVPGLDRKVFRILPTRLF